jgi:hypothetical protein
MRTGSALYSDPFALGVDSLTDDSAWPETAAPYHSALHSSVGAKSTRRAVPDSHPVSPYRKISHDFRRCQIWRCKHAWKGAILEA